MTWNNLQKTCITTGSKDISCKQTIHNVKPYLEYLNDRSNTGSTALHLACTGENKDLVRYLLHKGAIIQPNFNEETPLHWAAHSAPIPIIRTLLRYSSVNTINHRDTQGKVALDWAVEAKRWEVVDLISRATHKRQHVQKYEKS